MDGVRAGRYGPFEGSVKIFDKAISLWVVRAGSDTFGSKGLGKGMEKCGFKLPSLIRCDL